MLYHLFICRHAQAQNPTFNQPDFERQLTPQGIKEAERAGDWLQQLAVKPNLVVCSKAQRTRSTASIIATTLAYNQNKIVADVSLYNASEAQILNFIAQVNQEITTLVLVGHNPGVSGVVSTLSGTFQGNVPTGSVHHLSFECAGWEAILVTTPIRYEAYLQAAY
ncbi:SixA phosphatase family protein [Adhaeribacter pallidiroseus]|uniref:Phosphohistidine phosphatase n=1 Tax=Adhaeribacter pallidiroseus TaxID=2072847 RepID=A0A369QHD0_9BACT|nr:histidine phosphatase family protein [Adhaeribacter pallidiroseus]RDC62626.1 hypothetical protein AHMF7616_01220 [Adhaeribacter pallidiroseus]